MQVTDFLTLEGVATMNVQDLMLINMCRMLFLPASSILPAAVYVMASPMLSVTLPSR